MSTKRNLSASPTKAILITMTMTFIMVFFSIGCNRQKSQTGMETAPSSPPPPPPPPSQVSGVSDVPYEIVSEMPVFKGGEDALLKFVFDNTKYPDSAKIKGIQGKVIVRFAVEKDGRVSRVSVLRGVDPYLDMESVRVVSALPAFEKPAMKDGKAVAVWYNLPIDFRLH